MNNVSSRPALLAVGGWVECIATTIAREIEPDNSKRNSHAGEDPDLHGGEDLALGMGQHSARFDGRPLRMEPEKSARR